MVAETDITTEFWGRLRGLWERSSGGADVADRPVEDRTLQAHPSASVLDSIIAPRSAGVDEASKWFDERHHGSTPRLLFLVGGPGSGKSHAARHLVEGLTRISPQGDHLAHRTYVFEDNADSIILVNDATIPSEQFKVAPLSHEISTAIKNKAHLITCVNRGVLVEELTTQQGEITPQSRLLLDWLSEDLDNQVMQSGSWKISPEKPERDANSHYLKTATLIEDDSEVAELICVYMDVCSLLESSPTVDIDDSGKLIPGRYRIQQFSERRRDSVTSCVANSLLDEILTYIGHQPKDLDISNNPVLANLISLATSTGANGVLTTLRGAEIAAGQRLTFRELWGALVRAILGNLTDGQTPDSFPKSIPFLPKLRSNFSIEKTIIKIKKSAQIRFSQSLFGDNELAKLNPVTRLTSHVDPVLDEKPGYLDAKQPTGWHSHVSDAFAGISPEASPLTLLRKHLDGQILERFENVLTAYDENLDSLVIKVLFDDRISRSVQTELVHWYAEYLSRLFAMSQSIIGFTSEVEAWTKAWRLGPNLPAELKPGLEALMRPRGKDSEGGSVVPLYDSRTLPIISEVRQPKIAVEIALHSLTTRSHGESLFLVIARQDLYDNEPVPILEISLDFALIREALAAKTGTAGITEHTDVTSPRLERYYSSLLVPGRLSTTQYRVVFDDQTRSISVQGL